jgi:hypothetical protein
LASRVPDVHPAWHNPDFPFLTIKSAGLRHLTFFEWDCESKKSFQDLFAPTP